MGTQVPLPKRDTAPNICCGQMARWIKMPLGRKIGLDPSDIVLDGDPAPPLQKSGRAHTNFRPVSIVPKRLDGSRCHLAWRLDPGQTVLDEDPALLPKKGDTAPNFRLMSIVPKRLVDQDALGMEVGLGPGHIVLDGDPAPPPQKRGTAPQVSDHVYCAQTAGWIKMPLVWR